MPEYTSNTTYAQAARRIEAAKRILITTHTKPDGDALGSTLALARALHNRRQQADIYWMGPVESSLLLLAADTPYNLSEKHKPGTSGGDDCDLVIITDTGSWSQVEPLASWLKPRHDQIIILDHHAHGDDVGSMRIVDSKAASSTQVLVPLLDEMKCELTSGVGGIAEALYLGLATDTGWFQYENARAEAFALAARLLSCGVDKTRLFQIVEENFGPQRLSLQARALASLEYACNGAVAIQTLRPEDFKAAGAKVEDLANLINTPMTVGQVRVSILFSQTEPGLTKVSFRSKPEVRGTLGSQLSAISRQPTADSGKSLFIDVNLLAQQFGGGGHKHAAGAKLKMDIDQAKAKVLDALQSLS